MKISPVSSRTTKMSRSMAFRGDTGPSAAGVDADAAASEAEVPLASSAAALGARGARGAKPVID